MAESGYILLVEDDQELRELMVELLTDAGYAVRSVTNGQEALAYLENAGDPPRLVLLDDMMPVMSGRALIQAIAVRPKLVALPVCLLTASADLRAAPAPGTVAAIQKPFNQRLLMDVVQRYLTPPKTLH